MRKRQKEIKVPCYEEEPLPEETKASIEAYEEEIQKDSMLLKYSLILGAIGFLAGWVLESYR